MPALIEPNADCGYAVRRNGTILLRTATETEAWAMGNGLCLLFGVPAERIDFDDMEDEIREAWAACVARSDDQLEVVQCRAVPL